MRQGRERCREQRKDVIQQYRLRPVSGFHIGESIVGFGKQHQALMEAGTFGRRRKGTHERGMEEVLTLSLP